MAYEKTTWVQGSSPAINANRLNNISNSIDALRRYVNVSENPYKTESLGSLSEAVMSLKVDDNYIFASGILSNILYKFDKITMETLIAKESAYTLGAYQLQIDNDYVYVTGGPLQKTVLKKNKTDLEPTLDVLTNPIESAQYGVINSMVQDDLNIYVGGQTPQTIWKLNKSDLVKTAESSSYGNNIIALEVDGSFVYAGGVGGIIIKYNSSDLSLTGVTSVDLGGTVFALTQDTNYIYAAVGTLYVIKKLSKTDLSVVATSPSYGDIIRALDIGDDFVYAAGEGDYIPRSYNISDLTLETEGDAFLDVVYTLNVSNNEVFFGGNSDPATEKWWIEKRDATTLNPTGTSIATALNITYYPFSLINGAMVHFIAAKDNEFAATTLNVNTLGAKNLYDEGTENAPEIEAGKAYTAWYDEIEDCFFLKLSIPKTAKPKLLDSGSFYLNLPSRPDIEYSSYQDLTISGLNFTPTVIILNPPLPTAEFNFTGLLSYSNDTDIIYTTALHQTGGRGLAITPLNESTWDRGFSIRISIVSTVFPTGAISGTCYWTALR